ncbi:MAG TPA: glycoside hydrolase family 13 protein [Lachnospiraceae bacterium]|nr:glycoside hydrolase family 13 protein [Lachnospiraceae bacterium]
MDRSAILHIPLSQYAFASKEKELTIRIRAARNDLTSVTLFYGDRACNQTPVSFSSIPMAIVASDELFDYYEVTFESPYSRVCYFFKLEEMIDSMKDWTYYYSDRFTKELADIYIEGKVIEGRSEYYQYPIILRDEVIDVPEWFKNAIVYNIFPDSFASGKRSIIGEGKEILIENGKVSRSRLGGTINGIMENLDYIQELGFNCIYLNPIFVAGESHKYDLLNYYHIDPCFGTDEDFRTLVTQVHDRGMHIIIDGVFNHCSWQFFAFEDVVEYGENSRYKDWFYDLVFPVVRPQTAHEIPTYACFAYERKMPKLNTSNKEVQEYFAEVCRYWIREFDIDGWRLDVANEIDRNFWRMFREAAKKEKSDVVLIGEVWENSDTWLRGDAFDSTMNYDFRKHCRDFFALSKVDGENFSCNINQMLLRYPRNQCDGQLNLLDSHDVPRFLSLCNGELNRWRQAYLFLMLSPGVPSLFYGDEKEIEGITECEYRSPMRWESSGQEEFVRRVISIRKQYLDYRMTYRALPIGKGNRLFAFSRSRGDNEVLVYLNATEEVKPIELAEEFYPLITEGIDGGLIGAWGYGVYLKE